MSKSRSAAKASKEAQEPAEPAWRIRIAAAVAPHGKLKAIADAAGMESPQLQKIANGTTKDPGIATLKRIAGAMGLTTVELIDERPSGEGTGHGQQSGGVGLADSLRRAIESHEKTGQFPKDWRGDIMLAIFTLTRALQRPGELAKDVDRSAASNE